MAALAVMGAADVVSVVIRFSLVQLRTPAADARPGQRGQRHVHRHIEPARRFPRRRRWRALFGAVPAVAIGGAGVFLVMALWLFLFPELRRIRSLDEATEAKAASIAGTETL